MQPFASKNPLTPQSDSQQQPSLPAVPVPESVAAASQNSQPQSVAPAGPPAAAADSLPELADDGDLIEKEWVQQAKHIMHATAHDPYEQSKQFSSLRADYMQKRYGKTIKAED